MSNDLVTRGRNTALPWLNSPFSYLYPSQTARDWLKLYPGTRTAPGGIPGWDESVMPGSNEKDKASTADLGGAAARYQQLIDAGLDEDTALLIVEDEMQQEQFYAELNKPAGGGGANYTREVATIQADAERDVARMQVDAQRYDSDMNYRAAVDVARMQIDGVKYQSDMAYREAVDTAQIQGDAARDVARMQVDADRYSADASYRSAVDVANINAYTDRMLGMGQLGLGYYQTLAEMQKNPADWTSYWYATQGQKLPGDYQGPGIPEGLQLPSWLQGLYEEAGYEPNTWSPPIPSIGAQPELLGPPSYSPTPATGANASYASRSSGIPWLDAARKYLSGAGRTFTPQEEGEVYRFYKAPPGVQESLGRATPEEMAALAAKGERDAQLAAFYGASPEMQERVGRVTPDEWAALAAAGRGG